MGIYLIAEAGALSGRIERQSIPEPMSGCRLWIGHIPKGGYPVLKIRPGVYEYAHRVAFRLAHGPIPDDKPVIRHRCDIKSCVEPRHLVAGTQADNCRDAVERGRNKTAQLHTPEAVALAVAVRRRKGSYGGRRGAIHSEAARAKMRAAWGRRKERDTACAHT